MSDIKPFRGLELPPELEDLLFPLIPYLLSYTIDSSPSTNTRIHLEFYFPANTIRYDVERMQQFFHDISMHIDYAEPVYSWSDPYTPITPHRRLGETVICNLIIHDHTRTKKPTGTSERSKGPTNDSSTFSEIRPKLPPQRFA